MDLAKPIYPLALMFKNVERTLNLGAVSNDSTFYASITLAKPMRIVGFQVTDFNVYKGTVAVKTGNTEKISKPALDIRVVKTANGLPIIDQSLVQSVSTPFANTENQFEYGVCTFNNVGVGNPIQNVFPDIPYKEFRVLVTMWQMEIVKNSLLADGDDFVADIKYMLYLQ